MILSGTISRVEEMGLPIARSMPGGARLGGVTVFVHGNPFGRPSYLAFRHRASQFQCFCM